MLPQLLFFLNLEIYDEHVIQMYLKLFFEITLNVHGKKVTQNAFISRKNVFLSKNNKILSNDVKHSNNEF